MHALAKRSGVHSGTGKFAFGIFEESELNVVGNLMAHDGRAIANFILDYADQEGRQITNLSLQKLVYFCHVWSLIRMGEPLVKHQFEAWEYGPVLPYLYREFKHFDAKHITSRATKINVQNGKREPVDSQFDMMIESYLIEILKFYTRLRSSDLVNLSHVEGGPWFKVWHHNGRVNPGMKIDNEDITTFYSSVPEPITIQ